MNATMAQEQENIEKEMRDADSYSKRKRSHVPTPQEVYYHELAHKTLPSWNVLARDTVQGMTEGAPWLLAKDQFGKPYKRSEIKKDPKETGNGFALDNIGNYFSQLVRYIFREFRKLHCLERRIRSFNHY